jgi:hypothetical protein
MSHSFHLEEVNSPLLSDISKEMGGEEISFVDGYPAPQENNWPKGYTYVYQQNKSARALEVEYDGSTFQVRIFAASSPHDYGFAVKLATAVSKLHGVDISPEDNNKMGLPEFVETYNESWIEDHSKTTLSMLLGSQPDDPEAVAQIPGVGATMRLGPRVMGQLMEDKANLAQEFYYRLKKLNYIHLEDVYRSSIMVVSNKEGDKSVRLTTLGEGVPTLLHDKNTLVSLISEREIGDESRHTDLYVPLCKLPDIIGEKAKWLSEEILLVEGLEGDAWKTMTEKARSFHVEDIFDYGYHPDDDPFAGAKEEEAVQPEGDLTAEELKLLAYAPMVVFCMVAAADGNIDKKEIEAFRQELLKGLLTDSEILIRVTVGAMEGFEEMIMKLLNQEENMLEKLLEARAILDNRLPPEESDKFKASLMALGEAVASASGGFLGIFGSKIDKNEEKALSALSRLLGISE